MINKIKIGVKEYDLEYTPETLSDLALGTIDYSFNKIRIFKDLGQDNSFITLLHECYHAYCRDAGKISPDDGQEEADADFFAIKTLQLFRENPDLIEYLK